ncbi:MAG: 50S ribosomal protein L9 [Tenericutes bacterium HGW-Tenericutes-2]|nr:MAG: 50S ribosomal protein L9 [Tenericutes bacterium HGW-Tenericutes-2]
MKRWLFLIIASVIFIVSVILYTPYFNFESGAQFFLLLLMLSGMILVFAAFYISLNYQARQKVKTLQNRLSMWTKLSYHVNQVGDEVFNELPIGIIALDDEFEIKWANPHAKAIFDAKIAGKNLKDVHPQLHLSAMQNKINFTIQIKNDTYDVIYRSEYKFFYIFNVTEREQVKQKYLDQIPALGIVYLDNLDEAIGSMDVSEQSSLKGEYLAAIADWANKYDGFLKPYADERLVVLLYRKQLNLMIQDKFDILDKIRSISTANQVRVSISMGVASWDVDYEELGIYAQNAVELAEKRGGDQVVVNIQDQKIAYFGAKNDAAAKSSRVGVRINAQTIKDFTDKASNIFVMGHNQADLDAFGSMIAVYHMAKVSKKPVYMVVDEAKLDNTVIKVYELLKEKMPNFTENVVTSDVAITQVNEESLLIVVDSQSPKIVMSQELLKKVNKLIVIDHHRVGEDTFDSIFSFIEPYASSTIELVMELLNFYNTEEVIKISPFEATIMYGGLVVDTNNFSYRTGSRTFEVASKLKDLGADITDVKLWLRRDLMRTLEINKLLGNVEIFLDRFAFVVTSDIYDDRILLAQVAEALLQINGIDAAFMISRMGNDKVGISARSYQQVNVQILMEAFGGGGHLNSAAAQIENQSLSEVYNQLKTYLELEYGGGGELVKVILLEDVKGKGKKDDVIEVASGFGQFLVTQKKAMLATDENMTALNKAKEEAFLSQQRHIDLMKKLKSEIDNKKVTLGIQIGQDGKLFGSVTTKQIVEAFEDAHHILIDKKKVELSSDINSVGIYTATVSLHKDIKALFEVHIVEK